VTLKWTEMGSVAPDARLKCISGDRVGGRLGHRHSRGRHGAIHDWLSSTSRFEILQGYLPAIVATRNA
jgi:hypothetical protein